MSENRPKPLDYATPRREATEYVGPGQGVFAHQNVNRVVVWVAIAAAFVAAWGSLALLAMK